MSAREITTALKGRWCGSYGMACCPVHADRIPSLKISDSDNTDDGIDVVCFAGCNWKDVKDELRATGLLPAFEPGQHAPQPSTPRHVGVARPDPQKLANIEYAREIWAASLPAAGTHVETYLQRRGITAPLPPTIRFHPGLLHRTTGVLFPAMVAAISGLDKKLTGVQRTYLRLDGLTKAPVSNQKLSLGRLPGDAVRLGPAAEEIGIAEGIETGLSALQLYDGSVWCACGSPLDKIALPDIVKNVHIYADNGEEGAKIAAKACGAYRAQGRAVTVINPPSEYGDFNDILTRAMEAAA